MAKITAEQLEIARGWQEFGERLGWEFRDNSGVEFGRYRIPDAQGNVEVMKITAAMRRDIERTWRDREGQPKVQPVNVAKIGAG